MRTYVSKMLVGVGDANVSGTDNFNIHTGIVDGNVVAFDWDKPSTSSITAETKLIGFVKGQSAAKGNIIAGPFPVSSMKVYRREQADAVQQQGTLTVTDVPGADSVGHSIVFQTIHHQNLSLVPNQIKSFMWSVNIDEADTSGSAAAFAQKIYDEWKAAMDQHVAEDGVMYVQLADPTTATITATAQAVEGSYNGIDRPEQIVFEFSATAKVIRNGQTYEDTFTEDASADKGTYTIVNQSVAPVMANGTYDHVRWMEDQHQGRLGFSDRRMWNNTKKYEYQAVSGSKYDYLIVEANLQAEGDQQNLMNWPVGCVIASTTATTDLLETDLEVALGSGAVITA